MPDLEHEPLSWLQMKFLSRRLLTKTDIEAANEIGISPTVVPRWKDEPSFLAAYNELGRDGLELAKKMVRQNMATAANTLADLLNSSSDRTRLGACETILTLGGMATTQNINMESEAIGKLLADLRNSK
jgi:hypothetical protein